MLYHQQIISTSSHTEVRNSTKNNKTVKPTINNYVNNIVILSPLLSK